ncbi:MAG: hypothetical protein JSV03_14310 [Planctomycetota bacterium]|nr:MAG: hypothetical protein JSV03_14310 [Planctomycetota bacterium]
MRGFELDGEMTADKPIRHAWLRALGSKDMPASIELSDGEYKHVRTFKHDFFAATGLYAGPSGKVVLKMGRLVSLFGLPMRWLGRWLIERELANYQAVDDLEGVPKCLGRWNDTGLVHVFVEGHPLQRHERVGDDFFPELERLIDELHGRDMAYVDLEKRENILVGEDGSGFLIDFQISWRWSKWRSERRGLQRIMPDFLGRLVLKKLQAGDRYHLIKHRRRHRPDTMTDEQLRASYRKSVFIVLHRWLSRPFTLTRRGILKLLTGRSRSPKQEGPEFM